MKKRELLLLNHFLRQLGNLSGAKFALAVTKNLESIEDEVEAIEKIRHPKVEYLAYDSARVELAEKHAKKDEDDKPVVENNSYVLEDEEAFTKALDELKEQHKAAIEAYVAQDVEYNKVLEEQAESELFSIDIKDVPDGITVSQMSGIRKLIVEDVTETDDE